MDNNDTHSSLHKVQKNHPEPKEKTTEPSKRKLWLNFIRFVGFLVGLIIGAVFVSGRFNLNFLPFGVYAAEITSRWHVIAVILALIPLYWIVIAVHELGHLVAGKLVGYVPLGTQIGPFIIMRRKQGVRFKYNWTKSKASGYAYLYLPNPNIPGLRWREFVMVASGPGITVLFGWLVLSLHNHFHLTQSIYRSDDARVWTGFALTALGSIAIWLTVIGLYPSIYGIYKSDSARLWQLLRMKSKKQLEEIRKEYWVGTFIYDFARPRDWDLTIIDSWADDSRPTYPYNHTVLHYHQTLDKGDYDKAHHHLDNALEMIHQVDERTRSYLYYEASYFYAFILHSGEKAKELFDKGFDLNVEEDVQLKPKIALALLDGDGKTVCNLVSKLKKLISKERNTGLLKTTQEWLEQIKTD